MSDEITSNAIASFGSKDLLDPERTRKKFQTIEMQVRRALDAARGHSRRAEHPGIPDGAYPLEVQLPEKFVLSWHAFKVTWAPKLSAVLDIELELEQRRVRDEQVRLMEQNLRRECQEFVADYVMSFRKEVAAFCEQVVEHQGQVHGRTLTAIRDRIERFHAMNVFGDSDAASKLDQLKQQIAGLTGQDLAENTDVAAKLSEACSLLRDQMLSTESVSALTGRLRRRVVLE